MKAIGVTTCGGPEVLHVVELPEPHAGAGEVRIRVHAASVNPTDTLFRAGSQAARLSGRPAPYVPGMDVAGVIDELGPETDSRLKVGDRVVAFVISAGPHDRIISSILLKSFHLNCARAMLRAAPIENRIFQAVCGAGDVDRFRPQHGGGYTYAGNEACKHVCLQKSTEIKCCVQGRCKQRRDLGSKLVHHAGRGENSILVLLCLDEAQNVLKTS